MLLQLDIHNVALIDHISVELGDGLNVLTGETGAGKSIIIDSINAILGERVSKELIRTGRDKASVQAVFQVENDRLTQLYEGLGVEPEEDGTLIISREFTVSGKNICRINGKMATVSMLKEIAKYIIDIHGQYDNQSLLRTDSHIEMLDAFGGVQLQNLKEKYQDILSEYRSVKSKLKSLSGEVGEREKRIDLLKFQIDEINKAKLKPREEEELNKQRTLLANSEKVVEALSGAYEHLFSGNNIRSSAVDNISQALTELNSIRKLDDKFGELAKRLEELSYQMDDFTEDIRKEREAVEYDPDLLEQMEERLDLIQKLKRKYGSSIEEVLEYCSNIENELDELVKSEEIINKLNDSLKSIDKRLFASAQALNTERKKAAAILEGKICQELADLEMKKSQFKVAIEFNDSESFDSGRKYTLSGLDKVEFLISANPGEPLKPLAKIASGGEMSRIMLAIKTILADVDSVPTLIFDEIDIGISGIAAQKVGEKLSFISRNHQVICVTHLAQIACMADSHYMIEKVAEDDATNTRINRLSGEEVSREVARILGGANISEITLKHAQEMIENAKKMK